MKAKVFASVVSLLFNPALFFLIIPFFVVYKETASGFYALKWVFFSSLFIFLGVLYFLVGRIRGTFSDFDISKKEERKPFYFFAWFLAVIYLLTAVFLKGIFFPLSIVAIGIVLGLMVFEFVNNRVKASVHVGTACAFVITVGILYGNSVFSLIFWIVPLIAWSRLELKRHSLGEAVIGGMLGTVLTLVTFFIGRQFSYLL